MKASRRPTRPIFSLRPPWLVWRKRTGDCEIAVELHYATPLICALALLIVHLAGATAITSALLAAASVLIGISSIWAWQMACHARASRWLEARWVQVGDVLEEHFSLSNGSSLPVLWAEIIDHSNAPGYTASGVRAASSKQAIHWTCSGTAARRGEFHLGPWSVETGDPFGIFVVRIHYPRAHPLLIYPPIADLPFPPLPRGAAPGPLRINRAAPAPTVNAGQVRPYELGDPFRHIHWPSTARRGELIVKMFDQEASANAWLLIDTDPAAQSGQGDSSTEETSVLAAASLAAHMLREGRAVGLCAPHVIRPARGAGHLWTILGELARLPDATQRQRASQPLDRVLNELGRTLRAGASLVILTPSGDPAWLSSLAQLAYRQLSISVILIDPAPGGRPALERVAALLSEQGIAHRTVRCDAPMRMRPALGKTRRWEFKTLATGRVIATAESAR